MSKKKTQVLYLTELLIICLVLILPFWGSHKILATADWQFHASRVQEIYLNLKQGHFFTFTASHTFQGSGSGSFLFYPYIFLYPWAILKFFFSATTSFYIWQFLIFFSTVLIAFFSMKSFCKNDFQSFVFAICYVFNPYHLYVGTEYFVLGEFIAMMFIPLVLLGIYKILFGDLNKQSWVTLAVGMTGLIYAHVLSTIIVIEVLTVVVVTWVLRGWNNKGARCLLLIKASIWTIGLCAPIFVPFLTDYVGQNIHAAKAGIDSSMLISFADLFSQSLTNKIGPGVGIGIFLLVALFGGWSLLKNKSYRSIYIASLILIVLSTSVFPWNLFKDSFLGVIQFPFRYLGIATALLSIIFSKIVVTTLSGNKLFSFMTSIAVLAIAILFLLGSNDFLTQRLQSVPQINGWKSKNYDEPDVMSSSVLSNQNYDSQFGRLILFGETDYYPEKAYKNKDSILSKRIVARKTTRVILKNRLPNEMIYEIKARGNDRVDLPIVKYKNTKVVLNGRKILSTESKRGTVSFSVNRGTSTVRVAYSASVLYWISVILSFTLLLITVTKMHRTFW